MGKVLVLVLVCASCVAGEGTSRNPRWPEHRKIEEKRIADLELKVAELEREIAELVAQLPMRQAPATGQSLVPPAPATIDRESVTKAIAPVKPQLVVCGEQSGKAGTVKVVATVTTDGHVSGVTIAETPDPALGNCVAAVVKTLTFPATAAGATFSYPIVY